MTSVMSFNLRREGDTGERAWALRRPLAAELIARYRPLLIGTQEGKLPQLESLKSALPGYLGVGVSRRGNTEDEYCAILYDSERVELLRSGNFWLSETPDVAGSMLPGSGHPRMATWGEFQVPGRARSLFMFNTHLALQPDISHKQIDILLRRISAVAPSEAEVLVTGDFNLSRTDEAIRAFTEAGFQDAFQLARDRGGPDYSFHGWKGETGSSPRDFADRRGHVIDWLFYRNGAEHPVEEMLMDILTAHRDHTYPSDHFPVLLSTLGRPEVSLSQSPLSTRKVVPDEPLSVVGEAVNEGERGLSPLRLVVDDEIEETRWLVLDHGEKAPFEFVKRFYAPGKHTLGVMGEKPHTVSVEKAPAALSLLNLSLPAFAQPNSDAVVFSALRNTGGERGTRDLALLIDGQESARESVSVEPGETVEVAFHHTFTEPGKYDVTVGDTTSALRVYQPLPGPWTFAPGAEASEWREVALPAAWEKHSGYLDDRSFGWYRTEVVVPESWRGRPLQLVLGRIDDVDQTFFNQREVGRGGRFPEEIGGYETAADTTRLYSVPPDGVRYGETNELLIKVYDNLGEGGITSGPLGILPI